MTLLLGFDELGGPLHLLVCVCVFPRRSDAQFCYRRQCLLLPTDVFCFVATLKRPKLDQDGRNRVLRALYHKDHHYTNFIQLEVLAIYSFGPEPNEIVLLIQETNQKSRYSRQVVCAYLVLDDVLRKFPWLQGWLLPS